MRPFRLSFEETQERPDYLSRGEVTRLIPAVGESNKEIRLLSPVLATMRIVPDYARAIIGPLGIRFGKRTTVECYSEVVFDAAGCEGDRPDGLIVVSTGHSTWRALVEAKHGKKELDEVQVARYLELAKKCEIDAVITISNQFAGAPRHSPVRVPTKLQKKVQPFHLSWFSVRTAVELLISSGVVDDPEQALVLRELHRYLLHDSAAIEGFTKMNSGWQELTKTLSARGRISRSAPAALATAADWIQEQRDLQLILSREIQRPVSLKLPRKHLESQDEWHQHISQVLVAERVLEAEFGVPDAAAPIRLEALIAEKTIAVSMKLKAPTDRKSTTARINWVIRQLSKTEDERITLRVHWPSRKAPQEIRLLNAREYPEKVKAIDDGKACNYIEILLVDDTGNRFGTKKFVESVERALTDFYDLVGQRLSAFQPPAPKTVSTPGALEQGKGENTTQESEQTNVVSKVPENMF